MYHSSIHKATIIVTSLLLFVFGTRGWASSIDVEHNPPAANPQAEERLPKVIDFNQHIRPILSDKCYACHGPDVENNKADLRLDVRAAAIAAKAFIPGNSAASEMIYLITSDDEDEIMPPLKTHKKLSRYEKKLLAQWIDDGAEYDVHWAYKRIERPRATSIDQIVHRHLLQLGLNPAAEAPRETLLRRVYLDLIGLPPTPDEAAAFLKDRRPDAYEKLVDRLLASPHFGETLAIDWLDAVRYADTIGYHSDKPRDASPFRDYVINAFNNNMPYDQFVTEQLAGDLLPNATIEQKVASGFNRLNQISHEGGIQDLEYIKKYQAERVRTTATAFLGSTLACAECHDHKYDPYTAKDFYAFGAFFADILERGAYNNQGKFQEADISKYTTDPDVYNAFNFGITMRVQNQDLQRYAEALQPELAKRREHLTTGTAAAHKEFDRWLAARQRIATAGTPASYDLPSREPQNEQTSLDVTNIVDHPSYRGEAFTFEVNRQQIRNKNKSAFAIHFQFTDADYWFYTGKFFTGKADKKSTVLRSMKLEPIQGEWVTIRIDRDQLRRHRDKPIQAITFHGKIKPKDPTAYLARNFRLITDRHSVPINELSQDGVDLLEKVLTGSKSKNNITALRDHYLIHHAEEPEQVKRRVSFQTLDNHLHGSRETPITVSAQRREIRILPRGNWMDDSGEIVNPATPSFLGTPISSTSGQPRSRLDLAAWLFERDNPLTARTYVNRVWGQFFANPLTNTPEDLGLQGQNPTYPDVLDWLSVEFIESGWDIKQLVKTIVMSNTYRQSSRSSAQLDELDPNNQLLARQSPRRLKAELIRDNALAASGLLVRWIGGASAKPYQPKGYYRNLAFPPRRYQADTNDQQYRRGIYTHWQRTFLHPMLMAFDAPGRDECTVHRPISNTPLQALNLLNDPTFVEAAKALANQLLADHRDDSQRLQAAFQRILTRTPSAEEQNILTQFLTSEQQRFAQHPADAAALITAGHFATDPDHTPTELAAWTSLCRAILNLHETITRY